MNKSAIHGHASDPHSAHSNEVWPVGSVIALGFYDGATDGLLKCELCSVAFKFSLIVSDEDDEVRVFRLQRIAAGSFERIVDFISNHLGGPMWPVWVPIWNFPSVDSRSDVENVLRETLAQAGETEAVFASASFLRPVLALKEIAGNEVERTVDDWFGYLGIARLSNRD
jgi:hypothetical protein